MNTKIPFGKFGNRFGVFGAPDSVHQLCTRGFQNSSPNNVHLVAHTFVSLTTIGFEVMPKFFQHYFAPSQSRPTLKTLKTSPNILTLGGGF